MPIGQTIDCNGAIDINFISLYAVSLMFGIVVYEHLSIGLRVNSLNELI